MILYLDASAMVKLYAFEEHSSWTRRRIDRHLRSGGVVARSVMGYVEARAAFARARKRHPAGQRISDELYRAALCHQFQLPRMRPTAETSRTE